MYRACVTGDDEGAQVGERLKMMWCRKFRSKGREGPGASGSSWMYVYRVVAGSNPLSGLKDIVGSWRVSSTARVSVAHLGE